jgi:hypothetical protein
MPVAFRLRRAQQVMQIAFFAGVVAAPYAILHERLSLLISLISGREEIIVLINCDQPYSHLASSNS